MAANQHCSTAVIGGGPAGLFSAVTAAENGSDVTLFERNNKCGRKLLISGSGKCNITHTGSIDDFLLHFGKKQRQFLKPAFLNFFRDELFHFFREYDIGFSAGGDGKYFPESGKASSVLSTLITALNKITVKVQNDSYVFSVRFDKSSGTFNIVTKNNEQQSGFDKLILCAGGKSRPLTGSDGNGYRLAEALGHSVVPPQPALTDIHISDFSLSGCMGISFRNASLDLFRKNKKEGSFSGDMLITHRGFSGPVILDNSGIIQNGDQLRIDFTGINSGFSDLFKNQAAGHGKKTIAGFLQNCGFARNFIRAMLGNAGIDSGRKLAEVSAKQREIVCRLFTESTYNVSSKGGWKTAMLTSGGISLEEIDRKTMQSRIVPGLFFAGEIMNIDGGTGGYNLQAAFSTACLAGIASARAI